MTIRRVGNYEILEQVGRGGMGDWLNSGRIAIRNFGRALMRRWSGST